MRRLIILILLVVLNSACSSSLHQREIQECRELAFADETRPIAVVDEEYQDCLTEKREMKKTEQQVTFFESVIEVLLRVFFGAESVNNG